MTGLDSDSRAFVDDRIQVGGDVFEKYNGVKLDDSGNLSNEDFIKQIIKILKKNGVRVFEKQIVITNNK